MTERVSERLDQLEQAVRRAAELISRLTAERGRLAEERTDLQKSLAAQARDLENARARLARAEEGQGELVRLRKERREILTQVDGILKELNTLEPN
jgi:predicted  nucleic acid-binding Zn-ribbon protein